MKKIFLILSLVFVYFFCFSQEIDVRNENSRQEIQNDFFNEGQNIATPQKNLQTTENDVFYQENSDSENASEPENHENSQNDERAKSNRNEKIESSKPGLSKIPDPKRPKPIDAEKAEKAREKDETKNEEENVKNTIKYGLPSEISKLAEKLVKDDDPRFSEELYDVFQETKNAAIQLQILKYFTKQEDPCLEDFAVEILNDPYDAKNDLVKACFEYVSAAKTKEAIPAVLTLIESENEDYFNDAISAIGEIGGPSEAIFLIDFLDRDDLSDAQRQILMKTCGKMRIVETWDKIISVLEDEDENSYVRMYAAEALGLMEKEESVPALIEIFTNATDPNLRQYALKGLSHFPKNKDANDAVIQGIRDEHWRVRQEAIKTAQQIELSQATPFLIYRVKNDNEKVIKEESVKALAHLNTKEGNEFLLNQLADKKTGDATKKKIIECLLKEGHAGEKEILALAEECLKNDVKKDLRYSIGKELAKYQNADFEDVCLQFLESKDTNTISLGLDIYKTNKFLSAEAKMRSLYEEKKTPNAVKSRIKKMLAIEEE